MYDYDAYAAAGLGPQPVYEASTEAPHTESAHVESVPIQAHYGANVPTVLPDGRPLFRDEEPWAGG